MNKFFQSATRLFTSLEYFLISTALFSFNFTFYGQIRIIYATKSVENLDPTMFYISLYGQIILFYYLGVKRRDSKYMITHAFSVIPLIIITFMVVYYKYFFNV